MLGATAFGCALLDRLDRTKRAPHLCMGASVEDVRPLDRRCASSAMRPSRFAIVLQVCATSLKAATHSWPLHVPLNHLTPTN